MAGGILDGNDRFLAVLLFCHETFIHSMEGKHFQKTLKAGAPYIVREEEGFPNDPDRKEGVMKGKHGTCYGILLTGLWPSFVLSGKL